MPLIKNSTYTPPRALRSAHSQTIYASYVRKLHNKNITYIRERINTQDKDFLDLDWAEIPSDTLFILTHGVMGNTQQPYIKGMIKACHSRGISALAWNNRGCSEEPNLLDRFYCPADTSDLRLVIDHVSKTRSYQKIALIGFSMGGSITLKYLGDHEKAVDSKIIGATVISTPCDHYGVANRFSEARNRYYLSSVITCAKKIFQAKEHRRPGTFSEEFFAGLKNFHDVVRLHLAPANGFKNMEDYWKAASSLSNLPNISVPTLMISSQDDSLLSEACYPTHIAQKSDVLFLETPEHGGHVGFVAMNSEDEYWSETRALEFILKMKV